MFQLGNTRFEGLKGFESLDVTREADYKEHALLGTKPSVQRVGDKLQTASVSIRLHSMYCNPEAEIDALEVSRNVGYILALYSGTGRYYGDFLIKTLRYKIEKQGTDGGIMSATVDLDLLEYWYKDRAAASRRVARATAFASAAVAVPFPEIPAATQAPEVATLERLSQMAGTVGRIGSALREALANPGRASYLLRSAARQAAGLSEQHGSLYALLNDTANPNEETTGLLWAMAGGRGRDVGAAGLGFLASRLSTEAGAGNLSAAKATAGEMDAEQARINAAKMPIAIQTAVGRKAF